MSPVPHFTSPSQPDIPSRSEVQNGISSLDTSADVDVAPSMLIVSPSEPVAPSFSPATPPVNEAAGKTEGGTTVDGIVTVGREVKEGSPLSTKEVSS